VANPVFLESERHRKLRVITSYGAEYGDNVHVVPVVVEELSPLVLDYPVSLLKDEETGKFVLHALLGFDPGENLFLEGSSWRAAYVPMQIRRQPFLVGYTAADGESATPQQAVISIDLDSKRVQEQSGEALFTEDGSRTDYLNNIDDLLQSMVSSMQTTDAFIAMITELDLIEPARVNVTFRTGEQRSFDGLHTISAERLGALSGEDLEKMHRSDYLRACHLLHNSLGQIQNLVARKGAREAG